jgi:hypothetical protein
LVSLESGVPKLLRSYCESCRAKMQVLVIQELNTDIDRVLRKVVDGVFRVVAGAALTRFQSDSYSEYLDLQIPCRLYGL